MVPWLGVKIDVKVSCTVVSDSAIPQTVACLAPLSIGILQERILE